MKTTPIQNSDWQGVIAVPPLARKPGTRAFDWTQNDRLLAHMVQGGLRRFLYGGNAFLYHLSLAEYAALLDWLAAQDDSLLMIPSAGPSFGRLQDQAPLLRGRHFPGVMHLPCGDPRDAAGLQAGLREFADSSATPLILYLKEETNFGLDRDRGLDCVARLVDEKICVGIKYAVVRPDSSVDPYLDKLLARVDRSLVVSGIGERPAIVHMQQFRLPGYTTGSGCIGASLTTRIFELCAGKQYDAAAQLREAFLPLEDIRDAWGPARVLHAATEVAGIANCGPIPPFVSPISAEVRSTLCAAVAPLQING